MTREFSHTRVGCHTPELSARFLLDRGVDHRSVGRPEPRRLPATRTNEEVHRSCWARVTIESRPHLLIGPCRCFADTKFRSFLTRQVRSKHPLAQESRNVSWTNAGSSLPKGAKGILDTREERVARCYLC